MLAKFSIIIYDKNRYTTDGSGRPCRITCGKCTVKEKSSVWAAFVKVRLGGFFIKKSRQRQNYYSNLCQHCRHRFGTYRGQCRKGVRYEDAIIGTGT